MYGYGSLVLTTGATPSTVSRHERNIGRNPLRPHEAVELGADLDVLHEHDTNPNNPALSTIMAPGSRYNGTRW